MHCHAKSFFCSAPSVPKFRSVPPVRPTARQEESVQRAGKCVKARAISHGAGRVSVLFHCFLPGLGWHSFASMSGCPAWESRVRKGVRKEQQEHEGGGGGVRHGACVALCN